VQVDPIKPTLKAPGIKRLKLKCAEALSNFAFKFNLRRYTERAAAVAALRATTTGPAAAAVTVVPLSVGLLTPWSMSCE
jgi:hypothetical protein